MSRHDDGNDDGGDIRKWPSTDRYLETPPSIRSWSMHGPNLQQAAFSTAFRYDITRRTYVDVLLDDKRHGKTWVRKRSTALEFKNFTRGKIRTDNFFFSTRRFGVAFDFPRSCRCGRPARSRAWSATMTSKWNKVDTWWAMCSKAPRPPLEPLTVRFVADD